MFSFRFTSETPELPKIPASPSEDVSDSETSAPVEVPSDAEETQTETQESHTPQELPPQEYSCPPSPSPISLIIHGKQIPLNGISCGIMNVYLHGVATGVFVGGSVGSLVGALAGVVISTVSVPVILLGNLISDAFGSCKKPSEPKED